MNKNVEIQFLGEVPTSICHFFCPSICPSCTISKIVHHVNKCVKWWYIQAFFFFFFFHFLKNFDFWQKITENENWQLHRHAPYLRNSIAYYCDFCYTCVKWWIFGTLVKNDDISIYFFHVFKIFIFWLLVG